MIIEKKKKNNEMMRIKQILIFVMITELWRENSCGPAPGDPRIPTRFPVPDRSS